MRYDIQRLSTGESYGTFIGKLPHKDGAIAFANEIAEKNNLPIGSLYPVAIEAEDLADKDYLDNTDKENTFRNNQINRDFYRN